MRWLTVLFTLPIFLYLVDRQLPRFYIFDPAKIQELSKAAIAANPNNVTALMIDLTQSLRKEYGTKHVQEFDTKRWFFKYVFTKSFNVNVKPLDCNSFLLTPSVDTE